MQYLSRFQLTFDAGRVALIPQNIPKLANWRNI